MKRKLFTVGTLVLGILLGGTGCRQETFGSGGAEIRFTAATGYGNGARTRTEYSGEFFDAGARPYERIDWVVQEDLVRICCDEAAGTWADYRITGRTAEEKDSRAAISPENGSLQWGGDVPHFFYAMYPSPEMRSGIVAGIGDGKVSGTIPPVQPYISCVESTVMEGDKTLTLRTFRPNMDYAYLYAAALSSPGAESVSLPFRPLMTAFEFTVKAKAGDEAAAGLALTALRLHAAATFLTGSFSATVERDGSFTLDPLTETGHTVEIPLRAEDVRPLGEDGLLRFTVFGLPVDQDRLTLELVFEGNIRRTLELRYDTDGDGEAETWLGVEACRKVFIRNAGVPSEAGAFEYFFESTDPEGLTYDGTAPAEGRVTSYKTRDGGESKIPVSWEVEGYFLSMDDALSGADPLPQSGTFLTSFTPDASAGSAEGETVTAGYHRDPGTETVVDLEEEADRFLRTATPRGSAGSPWNLSDPQAGGTSILESANTYIVNAPGFYRFPLVAGNGVVEGAPHPVSYGESNFRDYRDAPFQSPYLHRTSAGAGTPSKAFVLWEERKCLDVVDEVSWELPDALEMTGEGENAVWWLRFHIGAENIRQGTAVVAVADEDGTIMWSWLLWMTDYVPRRDPAYDDSSSLADITCTYDEEGHTVTFMPRNLGWVGKGTVTATVYAEASVYVRLRQEESGEVRVMTLVRPAHVDPHGAVGGHSPYYQFGRKDPMMPREGSSLEGFPELYGVAMQAYPPLPAVDGRGSAGESVRHPDIQYTSIYERPNDWCSDTGRNNWWCAGNTDTDTDKPTVKTVYDPCPAGYCLPRYHAFNGFMIGWIQSPTYQPNCAGAFDGGYYFYDGWRPSADAPVTGMGTIFFPACGRRDFDGSMYPLPVDGTGFYWCAMPTAPQSGYLGDGRYMVFSDGSGYFSKINPTYSDYRASGHSIRPAVEE